MNKVMKCLTVLFVLCLLCSTVFAVSAENNKYMIGDVDDDEDVNAIDATIIQRQIADMALPDYIDEDLVRIAGDVDEDDDLSALDVTLILRYCADMRVVYPIGEYREYPTAPTEAPTAPPTVAPTAKPDPYELPPI